MPAQNNLGSMPVRWSIRLLDTTRFLYNRPLNYSTAILANHYSITQSQFFSARNMAAGRTSTEAVDQKDFPGQVAEHVEVTQGLTWTEEEEKKLVRKIDLYLLPNIWLMYLLSYMDRTKQVFPLTQWRMAGV